jgi:hypothetical protein
MADESTEHRDTSPGPSGQPPRDDEVNEASRASNRRRMIIAGLLTPPAVMTLNSRRANAAYGDSINIKNYGKGGGKGG